MDLASKFFTVKTALTLKELVHHWAPEIGANPQWLAKELLEAILSGEFDTIDGLLVVDPDTRVSYTARGTDLREEIKKGDVPLLIKLESLYNEWLLELTAEASVRFAKSRDLSPPTWWRSISAPKTASEPVKRAFIYMRDELQKKRLRPTKQQVLDAFVELDTNLSEHTFERQLWAAEAPDNWKQRGRLPKREQTNPEKIKGLLNAELKRRTI